MKTKTEAKRQAILDEATQAFRELGFERTSMSEISARVGGSKATLYNYFSSKDELFFEVMSRAYDAEFEAVFQSFGPDTENVEETLYQFGVRFLKILYSPEVRANRHLLIRESGRTELGRLLYERGVLRGEKPLAEYLQTLMARGRLRQADPVLAARQLYALLETELLPLFLLQMLGEVTQADIEGMTARALEVFMAAYGFKTPDS